MSEWTPPQTTRPAHVEKYVEHLRSTDREYFTVDDVRSALDGDVSPQFVGSHLSDLTDDGVVERRGVSNSAVYRILDGD